MVNRRCANFDITLRNAAPSRSTVSTLAATPSPSTAGPYSVTAAYRARTAEGLCRLDPYDDFWQQTLFALGDPARPPGRARLMAAGSALFRSIMTGAVRDLWVRARTDLDEGTVERVRLRLAVHPPAVACLPWELLYDDERNELFAGSTRTPLVRVEQLFRHVGVSHSLRTELPISVLLAIPDDPSGQIDAEYEEQKIAHMLADLGDTHLRVSTLSGRFNVVELRKRVEQMQPDVLHYIGHGLPDGLLMWHREQPTFAAPGALRTVLQHAPSLKLAFLNACLAGQLSPETAFATMGPQLLQAGVPAVIAMQFEIADQVASEFAAYLYEELLTGHAAGAIDTAVSHARSNLYALAPDDIGYATPVLWLNADDGVVFELPDQALPDPRPAERPAHTNVAQPILTEATTPISPPQSPAAHDDAAELSAEAVAIQSWLEALETPTGESLDAELRALIAQRRREVHTLRNLFTQLHHLERTLQRAADRPIALDAFRAKLDQIRRTQAAIQRLDTNIPHTGSTA